VIQVQSSANYSTTYSYNMSRCSLILLSNLFLAVVSYDILALFPHPWKSHVDVFLPLTKALAEKGHRVTVVSHFPLKSPVDNYTDVRLGDESTSFIEVFSMDNYRGRRTEKWLTLNGLEEYAEYACTIGSGSIALQDFRKGNHTFDVIIAEFFNTDCFLGFVHEFKAPLIGISSSTIMHWINERFGNPTHPAYIPNTVMDYSDRLSFFERVENVLVGLVQQAIFNTVFTKNDERIAREFFKDLPSLREIFFNSSLLLVNTHFSLNLPKPQVPAVIEVGGIHLDKLKQLPQVS
jgi:glucuronosyltransferase